VDRSSDEFLFSADCGRPKALAGGKVLRAVGRLYLGGLKIYEGVVLEEMVGRLIGGVRDLATRHSDEFIRVRAAGVLLNGKALLLPSTPSPHLPSLAGLLVRAGGGYLGDELVRIDPVLRTVHPSPLPLLIDSGDLGLFPELGLPSRRRGRRRMQDLGAKTPRHPVAVEELGGRLSSPAPPGWVVFPTFAPGEGTGLRPIGSAEALFRFTESLLNLHVWTDRAMLMARDLLREVRAAELVVDSVPDAAELLRAIVSDTEEVIE
jgi:hypothetical protein